MKSAAPPGAAPLGAAAPPAWIAAWSALAIFLARSAVVFGLEYAHHRDPALAGLRLASAAPSIALQSALLALASVLLLGVAFRWAGDLSARFLVPPPLFTLLFLFLAGSFDPDPSRRIGIKTGLGLAALALAALAALLATGFLCLRRLSGLRASLGSSWRAAAPPLLVLLALLVYLRTAHGQLGARMVLTRVEDELVGDGWEVLEALPGGEPTVGVLCPAPTYSPEGAARPALVLSPPSRVRRVLPAAEGEQWLVGAAGIDANVAAECSALYPGHALRLRLRVDGVLASETLLALVGSERWVPLADGAGLRVRGGARLELESALIAPSGAEVLPSLPLRAGFSGLRLERRERIPRARSSPESPNLVLVVIDTLRADRTSAYGYGRATTPHLEALARRGFLCTQADATASWTWPSTASILTGLYPAQHGVEDAQSSFLPEALDTLPEALQRVGFTTAAWSGSPLIVPDKRFDQGFEFFDASRAGRLRRSDIVLPGALEWLGTAGDKRFFLYLHLMEPHAPYVPLSPGRARFAADVPLDFDARKPIDLSWQLQREGFDAAGAPRTDSVVTPEEQRWISELYDGSVWSADYYLGRLLARLDELGLTDKTIVAVTSDHGEELFDHGLLTHGHGLHRELVRVPLVLAGPGIPQGVRMDTPVSAAALAPTLARLGGSAIEGLGDDPPAGLDLLQPRADGGTLFSTRQGWWNGYARQPLFGLRRGSSVLHFAPEAAAWGAAFPGDGEVRLYDLATDPEERHDLAADDPERTRVLRDALRDQLGRLERRRVQSGAPPDEGTLEVLRGLGYIGK